MNRATKSLTLWLQCTGRGSRISTGKDSFFILDLGQNAMTLGDWDDAHDWKHEFFNPKKKGADGVMPSKDCPGCGGIIGASFMICPLCKYEFVRAEEDYDTDVIDLVLYNSVREINDFAVNNGHNIYSFLHKILDQVAKQAPDYEAALIMAELPARDWCRINHKRYDKWNKTWIADNLLLKITALSA